ncbi:AI-2E family transporter [Rubrimonas cliftonensis]|uniref:Putative permease n=1 Tax=Rubrimonas cliftonensis TaxID=89524 RepID=A0A1H3X7X0_9RHOB|nr:AI-2E family transporter [Rubrimonas cliftonensis]SDZ95476.1 putative permease [Rubrimonas cliftonensis]
MSPSSSGGPGRDNGGPRPSDAPDGRNVGALFAQWLRRTFADPQIVILLLIIVSGGALLTLAADVLAPILASVVIAWLMEAPAAAMARRGLSRTLVAALLTALFVALLAAALLLAAPVLLGQVAQLARALPLLASEAQAFILALPVDYPEVFDADQMRDFAAGLNADMALLGQRMVRQSVAQLPNVATIGLYLLILPLLVFFFVRDRRAITLWIAGFLPDHRPLADEVWADISMKMGGYVRGRAYEMAIVGGASYAAFWLLGLDYALLLATLSGLSVLIPYFGAPVVGLPVALTAFAQWGLGPEMMWTLAAYTVIQTIDGAILATIMLAGAVNLHPIAVMVALLVFGDLYGFWGVVFAVPLASVVQVTLDAWRRRAGRPMPPPDP